MVVAVKFVTVVMVPGEQQPYPPAGTSAPGESQRPAMGWEVGSIKRNLRERCVLC